MKPPVTDGPWPRTAPRVPGEPPPPIPTIPVGDAPELHPAVAKAKKKIKGAVRTRVSDVQTRSGKFIGHQPEAAPRSYK